MLVENSFNFTANEPLGVSLLLLQTDARVAHNVVDCEAELLEHLEEARVFLEHCPVAGRQTIELLLRCNLLKCELLPQDGLIAEDHFSLMADKRLNEHWDSFLLFWYLSEVRIGQDHLLSVEHFIERDAFIQLSL